MKKIILLIVVAVAIHMSNAHAQSFGGGIKGGLNASQVAGDGYSGFKQAGFHGGMYIFQQINNHFRVQMELSFTQKGSRHSFTEEAPGLLSYILRINYIELPILAQFLADKWLFEAGLSADFMISRYEEKDYQEHTFNDPALDYNFLCINSVLGIHYSLDEHWSVGIRSVNSINSIRKNPVEGNVRRYFNKFGAFNDVIQLQLSFNITGDR